MELESIGTPGSPVCWRARAQALIEHPRFDVVVGILDEVCALRRELGALRGSDVKA